MVVAAKKKNFFDAGFSKTGQLKKCSAVSALRELVAVLIRGQQQGELAHLARTVAELVVQKVNRICEGRCLGLRNFDGASAGSFGLFEVKVSGQIAGKLVCGNGYFLEQVIAWRQGNPHGVCIASRLVAVAIARTAEYQGIVGPSFDAKAPRAVGHNAFLRPGVYDDDVWNSFRSFFFRNISFKNHSLLRQSGIQRQQRQQDKEKIPHRP